MLNALNITQQDGRGRSLEQTARARHESVQQTVMVVRSTIEQYRAQPSSGGGAPGDGGYPIIGLVVLASSAGLPLPTSLILIISGSVAGLDGINPLPLFALVAAASLAGDCIGYWVGRALGGVLLFEVCGIQRSFFGRSRACATPQGGS